MNSVSFPSLAGIAASQSAPEEVAILYCISYEELNKRKWLTAKDTDTKRRAWELKFHYLHAVDMQHARFQFIMSHKDMRGININAIAPAIGVLAKDDNGDDCVADTLTV